MRLTQLKYNVENSAPDFCFTRCITLLRHFSTLRWSCYKWSKTMILRIDFWNLFPKELPCSYKLSLDTCRTLYFTISKTRYRDNVPRRSIYRHTWKRTNGNFILRGHEQIISRPRLWRLFSSKSSPSTQLATFVCVSLALNHRVNRLSVNSLTLFHYQLNHRCSRLLWLVHHYLCLFCHDFTAPWVDWSNAYCLHGSPPYKNRCDRSHPASHTFQLFRESSPTIFHHIHINLI